MYVWATEIVPAKYSTAVTVTLNTFDSGSLFFVCIYFFLISRDWFPLMLFMTVLSTIAFIITSTLLPESPEWLLLNGRTKEAIAAFNLIGRVNGVKKRIPETAVF